MLSTKMNFAVSTTLCSPTYHSLLQFKHAVQSLTARREKEQTSLSHFSKWDKRALRYFEMLAKSSNLTYDWIRHYFFGTTLRFCNSFKNSKCESLCSDYQRWV